MPYIDPKKINLNSLTWLDGDSDILVPLVDVKKAIAQTPTEDVVSRAELSILSVQHMAHAGRLQREISDLKIEKAVLENAVKLFAKRMREDAVEVVRCGECGSCYNNPALGTFRCGRFMSIVDPNDFCSYGERKANNEPRETD